MMNDVQRALFEIVTEYQDINCCAVVVVVFEVVGDSNRVGYSTRTKVVAVGVVFVSNFHVSLGVIVDLLYHNCLVVVVVAVCLKMICIL